MGLSKSSVGSGVKHTDGQWQKQHGERLIALAGNPNVGKSTLFNALTGMRQHTGNWPGKTVGSAYGRCDYQGHSYIFADIPGTYSLLARSTEEAVARDALLFGEADTVVVVCDALCLQRNIQLALQIREFHPRVIVCVNLLDEARRRGVSVDLSRLEQQLGLKVLGMSAGHGEGIDALFTALETVPSRQPRPLCCGADVTLALEPLTAYFASYRPPLPAEWLALRCMEGDEGMISTLEEHLGMDRGDPELAEHWQQSRAKLAALSPALNSLSDRSAQVLGDAAAAVCAGVLTESKSPVSRRLDRLLTHPVWGWPAMLALLAGVLWLSISAANVPSQLLSQGLFFLGKWLENILESLDFPAVILSFLFDGVYKTVAWVVSVMLPPMAIFFPLFTLLEDFGYLPRVAFNLDGFFARCGSCGKQALTMCMGFGCNAAGVVGCRIIDSPRERLIAVLTNSFVPCNGRFPTLIALISILFAEKSGLISALGLTGVVVLGVVLTLVSSQLLSATLLKGVPSSFTLELPPYRKPKVGEILLRSLLDRTLFVLSRAVTAAAPAGAVIWLLGNISFGDCTLLSLICDFFDPVGRILGLDGAILLAFLLGLPANEIVLPALLMCYLSGGSLMDYGSVAELGSLLSAQGWTTVTTVCMLLFSLLHWPCATTLLTIKKETGQWRYVLLAAALPTAFGMALCFLIQLMFG